MSFLGGVKTPSSPQYTDIFSPAKMRAILSGKARPDLREAKWSGRRSHRGRMVPSACRGQDRWGGEAGLSQGLQWKEREGSGTPGECQGPGWKARLSMSWGASVTRAVAQRKGHVGFIHSSSS